MDVHVRNVGWALIIMGVAMGVIAIGVLIAFHGYEGLLMTDNPFYKRKDIGTIPLDRVLAAVYVTYSLLMAAPLYFAGRGLLQWKSWARTGAMLMAAVNMLLFPIGTAVGMYTIWVLNDESCDPLFESPPVPRR